MYELEKLFLDIKQLEGKEDMFSIIIRDKLLDELENMSPSGYLVTEENYIIGRREAKNYD